MRWIFDDNLGIIFPHIIKNMLWVFTIITTNEYPQQMFFGIITDYLLIEPRHEKTCFLHMRTTKTQVSLRIRTVWSAPFFIRCLDTTMPLVSVYKISSLCLASVTEHSRDKAQLSSNTHHTCFSVTCIKTQENRYAIHTNLAQDAVYRKIPTYSYTREIAVITLKSEQGGFNVE